MLLASSGNIKTSFNNLEWGYKANTTINILLESSNSKKTRLILCNRYIRITPIPKF